MKLEWMGPYRDMIGDFYRSANGYSQLCKTEMFGDPVRFSPYEVQIMEHILEYADQHKNMKWYAERLGLSQATYSKYVRKLVDKVGYPPRLIATRDAETFLRVWERALAQ